jgi:hypothetical protein
MVLVSTTVTVLAFVFLAVAAIAAVAAISSITYSVAGARKDRLSRRESIRSYYGRVVLSH